MKTKYEAWRYVVLFLYLTDYSMQNITDILGHQQNDMIFR